MLMIDKVLERAEEFDVIHFHIDLFHFPLFRSQAGRTRTTLHGRQDLGDLKPFYHRFGEMPLVSISGDQRKPFLGKSRTRLLQGELMELARFLVLRSEGRPIRGGAAR